MTIDQIADLTDRQIIEIYFRPRDKQGDLIRTENRRKGVESEKGFDQVPAPATLDVPIRECGRANMEYMIMFWQIWTNRGLSKDEILKKWRTHLVNRGSPR